MQAIMETLFDIWYLTTVITLGVLMIRQGQPGSLRRGFGTMAVVLGCGDAFHLVPRAWALWNGGLEVHAASLGFGKLVTSVTMTIFYLLLYLVWKKRYEVKNSRGLDAVVGILAGVRIILCLMPQNDWLSPMPPLSWGIWRNIPFAILGLLMIVLFYRKASGDRDPAMKWMWLAITLSFGFYIPVVLWSDIYPLVGTLMIPKTLAYVWIVWMGWKDEKGRNLK